MKDKVQEGSIGKGKREGEGEERRKEQTIK